MVEDNHGQDTILHVGGRKNLPTNCIINFTADQNYTTIYLTDGTSYLVATTLKQIEARTINLCNFIRPNNSTIINTEFAVLRDNVFTLLNKRKVAFSRRRWKKYVKSAASHNMQTVIG